MSIHGLQCKKPARGGLDIVVVGSGLVAQDGASALEVVAAKDVTARQPAIQVVQHHAIAQVDRSVVRHAVLGANLHQDHVARLGLGALGRASRSRPAGSPRCTGPTAVVPPVVSREKCGKVTPRSAHTSRRSAGNSPAHRARTAPDERRLVAGRLDRHQLAGFGTPSTRSTRTMCHGRPDASHDTRSAWLGWAARSGANARWRRSRPAPRRCVFLGRQDEVLGALRCVRAGMYRSRPLTTTRSRTPRGDNPPRHAHAIASMVSFCMVRTGSGRQPGSRRNSSTRAPKRFLQPPSRFAHTSSAGSVTGLSLASNIAFPA
jgi:hypothetical protein